MPANRLTSRLKRLEGAAGISTPDEREAAIWREVLRRMTDAELHALEAALQHIESGQEGSAEDRAVADRVEALREEVCREEFA